MLKQLLAVVGVLVLNLFVPASAVHAEDAPGGSEAKDAEAAKAAQPAAKAWQAKGRAPHEAGTTFHDPHYEYGFDLKATNYVGKLTPLLGAHWEYIFRALSTHFGLGAEALPQIVRRNIVGGREKAMYYAYGLQAAQPIINDESLQAGVEILGAFASSNIRIIPRAGDEYLTSPSFRVIEPGVYVTFLGWDELDVGLVAGMRLAMNLDSKDLKTSDVNSFAVGVTFRERRH